MNIKEDFCDFETAKLLKEKGFDEKCLYVWVLDKDNDPKDNKGAYQVSSSCFMEGESYVSNEDIDRVLKYYDWYYSKEAFLCPTLSDVMKWLRKIHKLYVEIYIIKSYRNKTVEYCITIEDLSFPGNADGYHIWPPQDSYEKACIVGIKYILEHLI